MKKPPCEHPSFDFTARLLDVSFDGADRPYPIMEVSARCRECGEDYVFLDMDTRDDPPGQIHYRPHTSADRTRVYLPCAMASEVCFERGPIN